MTHSTGVVNVNHNGDVKLSTAAAGVNITGVLDVTESAKIGDILIEQDSRTIDTVSGNLILGAATDDIDVSGELFVSSKLHLSLIHI